jgi:hypothetical protein
MLCVVLEMAAGELDRLHHAHRRCAAAVRQFTGSARS